MNKVKQVVRNEGSMANWVVAAKRADFEKIGERYNIDPVVARIMINRGVPEDEIGTFLYGTKESLCDPFLMKDMGKAVDYICKKIKEKAKIRVIGDYDIDGICASYILKTGLQYCQADVSLAIPHRITDGYGLNEQLITRAYEDGIHVIVTCDNGISALSQIAYAKELGMEVIVTDHHSVPYEEQGGIKKEMLPEAVAILNPKRKGETYPNLNLCGAAVAYKFIEALYRTLGMEQSQCRQQFLQMAAIATVGDLMELQGENRTIVRMGLEDLRVTKNFGLKALMEVRNIVPEQLNAYHIGFQMGPCFNAAGRLETAMKTLELLETQSQKQAMELARELNELNELRKELTTKGEEEGIALVEKSPWKEDALYIVYLPNCHESIAGIVASRLKERYHRPIFVLTKGDEGIKGSGRSIDGYNMYGEMVKVKSFFTKFGGHPMAAGCSLTHEDDIEQLRRAMNENCTLRKEDLIEKIVIDVPMPFSYVTNELIEQLSLLEPFGMGNRKPVFATKPISIVQSQVMGKNKNVWKARAKDENGIQFTLIYFGDIPKLEAFLEKENGTFALIYDPKINEYNGKRTIQMQMIDYQSLKR